MEELGKYILSVAASAIIVGILSSVIDPKSGTGALVKLVGGLCLTVAVIRPVVNFDFDALLAYSEDFSTEGESAAAAGQDLAREAMGDIIKSETEAYILDKAGLYRADLKVEVNLSDDLIPVPVGVTIRGDISPYGKSQMQSLIESELNIPKENQVWTGTP